MRQSKNKDHRAREREESDLLMIKGFKRCKKLIWLIGAVSCLVTGYLLANWYYSRSTAPPVKIESRPIRPRDLALRTDPGTGQPMVGVPHHFSKSRRYAALVVHWASMVGKKPQDKTNEEQVMIVRLAKPPVEGEVSQALPLTGWIKISTQIHALEVVERQPNRPEAPEVSVIMSGSDGYIYVIIAREGRQGQVLKLDPKTRSMIDSWPGDESRSNQDSATS